MRIGLDATITHVDAAGSGVYANELICGLQRSFPQDTFDLSYGVKQRPPKPGKTFLDRFENIYLGTLWEFGVLPFKLATAKPDLFHALSLQAPLTCPAPLIVSILDLSVLLFPQYFNAWFRNHSRIVLPKVARRADQIITISEYSKQEIQRFLGLPPEKISVTYLGVSPAFKPVRKDDPNLARFIERNDLRPPFILHVGSFEPRKNIPALLEAFARLKNDSSAPRQLVFTGGVRWKHSGITQKIAELGLQADLRILGHVPTEELPLLYNAADLFVYPSLYEGFGMPVVEAMACGCPTVTSNVTSLPEVAGEACILVDPTQPGEISAALQKVIEDPAVALGMRDRGLAQVQRFTWERCAQDTMAVYQKVLAYAAQKRSGRK